MSKPRKNQPEPTAGITLRPRYADRMLAMAKAVTSEMSMRFDSWVNAGTGLGTSRDKVMGTTFEPGCFLSNQELSWLFHQSDLAFRIVVARPREMMRAGYFVTCKTADDAKKLLRRGKELRLDQNIAKALVFANLFGGAAVILGVDDGQDPRMPVGDTVNEVEWAATIDRRFVWPERYFNAPGGTSVEGGLSGSYTSELGERYGDPEVYGVYAPFATMPASVHESRVLVFDGTMVDDLVRRNMQGWGLSILQRVYDTLRGFESSFQSVNHLVADASQAVLKVKDLMSIMTTNEDALLQRVGLMDRTRAAGRAVIIDTEEEFKREPTSFTGLPEVLDRMAMRLSASTEIPVTLLMGTSPGGQNATGDSDFRAWYASCEQEREDKVKPQLEKAYRLIAMELGIDPDDIEIEMLPLWQMSAAEEALTEKNVADRDCAYISNGVWLPQEVALARRRGKTRLEDTEIDEVSLEKALEQERKIAADPVMIKQAHMPPPAPVPGQTPSTGPGSGGGKQPKGGVATPGPRTSKVNE